MNLTGGELSLHRLNLKCVRNSRQPSPSISWGSGHLSFPFLFYLPIYCFHLCSYTPSVHFPLPGFCFPPSPYPISLTKEASLLDPVIFPSLCRADNTKGFITGNFKEGPEFISVEKCCDCREGGDI